MLKRESRVCPIFLRERSKSVAQTIRGRVDPVFLRGGLKTLLLVPQETGKFSEEMASVNFLLSCLFFLVRGEDFFI